MAPATLSHRILSLIYPVKEPARHRHPDKPLSVLALGLSRSGTDSLRQALEQLGYSTCYHGTAQIARQRGLIPATNPNDMSWWHFDSGLTRQDFDRILADCRAVTDLPCSMFVDELLRCYPEAKVIVNFREDVEAWHTSIAKTLVRIGNSWTLALLSLFNNEMFWYFHIWRTNFTQPWQISNWDARGRALYKEHYAHLRGVLNEQGRQSLEWRAEEGWEPLCKYLEQPVPDGPFPHGNTTPEFQGRAERSMKARMFKSMINISILLSLVLGGSIACIWHQKLP
ncbi:hypothetical protein NA57DRAFT_63340 [Rhizodiscina lignyota]|uniref:P-loop containing nucleoside triphosphate hydrolase protein n=1 Tax=Rhizodiscina lignyota TaxID=1504668 RepID=A0A9P4ME90_9PEZI|nr:hypothetical protein NA57DRAFT_63340 [Rhizodiscina lignyota]